MGMRGGIEIDDEEFICIDCGSEEATVDFGADSCSAWLCELCREERKIEEKSNA